MTLTEVLQAKGEAVKAYREIIDRCDAEKRQATAEETGQLDKLEEALKGHNDFIEKANKEKQRREFLSGQQESLREPVLPSSLRRAGTDGENTKADTRSFVEKLTDYMDEGMTRREAIDRIAKHSDERSRLQSRVTSQYFRTGRIDHAMMDRAALRMDDDAAGGFLVVPEQFLARLIADLDRSVLIRGLATIIPLTSAESLGVPTRSADIADSDWTTELAVGDADTALAFGKRRLTPHPLAKYILVSKELLRSAALSVESIIRDRMSYKFGTTEETAFMTGHGSGRPLGIFTASASGISTGRDISTDNTTTAITADGLINAKYAFESQWIGNPNMRWIFHRDAVKMIRKLKDGNGQYLWQPGLTSDRPDSILDVTVLMSEYAPNTFTTGQYVGIIGDFSYYWIAENMSLDIQHLMELGALTNQDYFIGRMKLDAMPILENAFVRVKLG